MSEQTVLIGNLTSAPIKRGDSAKPVAGLRVASTPRVFDQQSQTWRDGQTQFTNASVFGQQARNVVASLTRGDRVVLVGTMHDREYTPTQGPNAGETVTVQEMVVSEVGSSLLFAVAKPERQRRGQEAAGAEVA